jgi:pimeloyl-ACP methyl ester carboxylesterase
MINSRPVTDIPPMVPGEQCWRLPFETSHGPFDLFLRHLPAPTPLPDRERQAVLYFNGARLASAVTVAHRIDGQSWRDDLTARGFDVWALDYLGYGHSDRYPQMSEAANANAALGRIREVSAQVEAAMHFILDHMELARLSLLAHSWGSNIAALVAIRNPKLINKMALFGPVTHRPAPAGSAPSPLVPAWNTISAEEWRKTFDADVPPSRQPLFAAPHFEEWATAYLHCDPNSATRTPPAVKVPWGGMADVIELWGGGKIYDPSQVQAPTLIVRGEWDSYSTDADAYWLFSNLINTSQRRDVKIGMGTHFMFYEPSRFDLYDEVGCFLQGRSHAS